MQKQAASLSAQRKAAAGSANSNERIRSYNYQDGRVSDHRIGVTLQVWDSCCAITQLIDRLIDRLD